MRVGRTVWRLGLFALVTSLGLAAVVAISRVGPGGAGTSSATPVLVTVGQGFDEQTQDLDRDGLIDNLILTPSVTVAQSGEYMINATLYDKNGTHLYNGGSGEISLAAGRRQIPMNFDGRILYRTGKSGPFDLHLMVVHFFDRDGEPVSVTEVEDVDAGRTRAYDHSAFQHDQIAFLPRSFSAQAVDTDGDGIYEQLVISGRVTVDTAGAYVIDGSLHKDRPWGEVSFAITHVQLAAGTNDFQLVYPGADIAKAGLDGPWVQSDLLCYPESNPHLYSPPGPDFSTPAFKASQFGS